MKKQTQSQSKSIQRYSLTLILGYSMVVIVGTLFFLELVHQVDQHGKLWFDLSILSFFAEHRTKFLDHFFLWITWVGSVFFLLPAWIVTLSILLRYHRHLEAILLGVGFGGASLINFILKSLLVRERPILFPPLEEYGGFAFPSGHTAQVTAFALSIFLIVRRTQPCWQWIASIALLTLVLGVSISRVYLQVHYPSDVLGGFLVALVWVFSIDALIQRITRARKKL